MSYYVYTLTDPRTNRIRYVGMTSQPEQRLRNHVSAYKGRQSRAEWVKELKAAGIKPTLTVVDTAKNKARAIELEKDWIERLHNEGHSLVNGRKFVKSNRNSAIDTLASHTTCDEDIANGAVVADMGERWERWCNALAE